MNSVGIADLSVRGDMDANKENADPIDDLTANVRDAAITAMAAHVDGSAKSSKKRSRGAKSSDSKKIETLFQLIDNADCLMSLVYDVSQYLSSTPKNNISDRQQPLSTSLAIDVLQFVSSEGKHQLKRMRASTNNTKAKSRAAQSHNKLTKSARQLSSSQEIQRRVLAPTNPRKMLMMSLKSAKAKLKIDKESVVAAVSAIEIDDTITTMAPRVKRRQLTSGEIDVFTSEERKRIIYNEIRLPRPQGGNMVMSSIMKMYIIQNVWYSP